MSTMTGEFTIGDKAVYPSQGVAEVIGIEKKEVYGKIQNFYVLRGLETGLRILVPTDKADQVGPAQGRRSSRDRRGDGDPP